MDSARPFGLERDPFPSTIDPGEAYASRAFTHARDALLRELGQGARLVVLVGAAGTGKTLLLRTIERSFAVQGKRARRFDRADMAVGSVPEADVVLIDEADRLDEAALAALSRAVADPAHPAVVLAAVRRRFDHIPGPVVAKTVELEEMTTADARELVVDRVRRVGGDPHLFTPGALGAITYAANGSPRLLRLLSAAALFQASQDGVARVEMGHARRAIAMKKGVAEDAAYPPEAAEADAAVPPSAEAARPEAVERQPVVPIDVSPRAAKHEAKAPPAAATGAEPVPVPPAPEPAPAPAAVVAAAPPAPAIEPAVVAEPAAAEPAPAERWDRTAWIRPAAAAGVAALIAGAAAMLWLGDARPAAESAAPVQAPAAPTTPAPTTPAPRPTEPAQTAAVVPPEPQPATPPVAEPPAPAVRAAPPVVEPAPAEPATPPPAPPVEPPPTVVVNYSSGQPGAVDAAERIAALLRARGQEVAEVRAVPARIRQPSTRYAAGDRAAGEALNAAFQAALQAYQPGAISRAAPNAGGDAARGTIEVWVPDSAAAASRPLRLDLPPG